MAFSVTCSFSVFAVLAAVVWTIYDRKRPQYRALYRGLRIYVRYTLAFSMFSYGIVKVIKAQFPFPSLYTLLTPYGDSSPFSLMWNFMGYSAAYTFFAGAAEVLAGALLLFRRTATLGALVAGGVLVNVGMLDLSYGVPEKLDVIFLLIMALIILAPDLGRLANLLIFNRPAAPAEIGTTSTSKAIRYPKRIIKLAFIAYTVVTCTLVAISIRRFQAA